MLVELKTRDAEEFAAAQGGWDLNYRPVTNRAFDLAMRSMQGDCVRIDVERYGVPIEITGSAPEDCLSFVVPLPGSRSYISSGQEVGFGNVDVFGAGEEVFALTRPGVRWVVISIPIEKMVGLGDAPDSRKVIGCGRDHRVTRCETTILGALAARCLHYVSLDERRFEDAGSNRYFLDELLSDTTLVLNSPQIYLSRPADRRLRIARRARDFMNDKKSDPPTILEVCAELDVPERTLHNAFTAVYGVSPKRYLMAQRLFVANQLLKGEGQHRLVSEIANTLGFFDLGRFAGRYKEMFGESPSETRRRASGLS